jgi:hypothetical protein
MSYWFYQINQENWEPERFRIEVWENERWSWTVGTLRGGEEPQPGDSVAFFYARAHGPDPGFYGWAVVLEYHKAHDGSKTLYFRPVAPTNHLKMHPWWNDEAQDLANEVRGVVAQGTVWRVSDELWRRIRRGITTWVAGRSSELSSTAMHAG